MSLCRKITISDQSCQIIEYLIDRYDTSANLTYTSSPEKYYVKQWLIFQVSGQGPYFGQGYWYGSLATMKAPIVCWLKGLRFNALHKEKLPSAIERYANEIKRVTGVLNSVLEGKDYLVGDKCTYADLSFIPWAAGAPFALGEHKVDFEKEYPNYHAWMERLMARPAVKKALAAMSG